MVYNLRPYQQQAVDAAVEFLTASHGRNGLIVASTGSGKSLLLASIVKRLDARCLVFQPSKEILEQNYEKMVAYGFTPSIYSASMRSREIGEITLATIGSVWKHPELFQDVKYVLCDEAHLINSKTIKMGDGSLQAESMYGKFLQGLPGVRCLGLTATPYRLNIDGYGGAMLKFLTRTNPRIFETVVHYTQNADLLRDGYLSPLRYLQVQAVNTDKLKLNTKNSDYTDKSVQGQLLAIGFDAMLERQVHMLLEAGRKNILVFTRFVRNAEALVSRIPGSALVTGETPKREREEIIAKFRSGEIKVVANCAVFLLGFDYPELDTVVLAAPTMSLSRYYQEVGRCLRPHPSKEYGLVVDMAGLTRKFGKVEDLHLNHNRGMWQIETNGRPLTNVYLGPKPSQFWRKTTA